ncbi:glutamine synthetase [Streptomyces griseochromogenes]|uniref:Glutamine synthetase n=1 Tax=Streptomyces griseochromogenes TaxID=68214 RepID=A0A1B1AVB4_9ACTN|nr:glutamine synthetase family protein [Streptomyces griseochromogenes]ANP50485.1 glutamine synthetase [Streptomyces griseochromogenes]MBP2051238.1 glutamine synthetase [Streptomyces griseochromogenes]
MSAETPPQIRQRIDALAAQGIDVIRVAYPDLIGSDRGRDVLLHHLPSAIGHGIAFCRAIYHTAALGEHSDIPGGLDAGMPDIAVRPDLATLVPLPWEPGVAWCIGDARDPETGRPAPESPRDLLRQVTGRLRESELTAVVGPELEYVLLDPDPASPTGWRRYAGAPGNVYTVGRKGDPDGHLLRTLRHLHDLGIGVTSGNREFDGGQFEINLDHSEALDAADRAFRFKAAVKELARIEGRLATFMAKPLNDGGGSGFHLHLSVVDSEQRNVFDDPGEPYGLSATARHAIAGLLNHAPALAALFNPTINSYKRFGPDTAAPWLIDWGLDNRGAMVRIPPERGSGSRLEIRLGDATANPYLAIAGLVAAVHLGISDAAEPPAPMSGYGYDAAGAPKLPTHLGEALDALEADHQLTEVLGKPFVDAFLTFKRDELTRFRSYVTDWEFREYSHLL